MQIRTLIAALLALSVTCARAEDPVPAEIPALSPAVEKAIKDLSADDFSIRENASANVQKAMAAQVRPLLSNNNEETQQRLVALLEFQDGITRWAIDAMKLPRDKRLEHANWALKSEVAPVISKLYSPNFEIRMDGIKLLAKMEGPESSAVLAHLLTDDRREIYLAAMEAVWDRKPTSEVVDALWQRAIDAPLANGKPRAIINPAGMAGAAVIRARAVNAGITTDWNKALDNDAATEVLVHLKAPEGAAKLDKVIAALNKEIADAGENKSSIRYLFDPYSESARNLNRMIDTYRTQAGVDYLIKALDIDWGARQQLGGINGQVFASGRTQSLVTLINISGQKHEDYKFGPANNVWNLTWAAKNEVEEKEAIEKIKKWYADHKNEKLPEKPADKDAVKPAAPAANTPK